MTQRPETPLKDLAATLRTLLRTNKAAADALVQIQEIEALAEDRLRPLVPELLVIKDDALAAARERDTTRLGEIPFRLRDLAVRAGAGQNQRNPPGAAADAAAETNGHADTPAGVAPAEGVRPDLLDTHSSHPSDRILPLAAPPAETAGDQTAADQSLSSPKRVAEALFQLHELRAAGVLHQAEYDAKKQELLDRL